MADDQPYHITQDQQSKPDGRQRLIIRIVLSLAILGAGIGMASYLKNSAPRTQKRPPEKLAPLVQVVHLKPSEYQIVVTAMGTVMPDQVVVLKSRVSGEVVNLNPEFTEGGFLKKDMKILQIDAEDYKLTIENKQKLVVEAEYALKLELGHQAVAQREWELLNGDKQAQDLEKELALRKPHLEKARSDLAAAKAELTKAILELDRTHITVPFNAAVRSKSVDLGSQVTPQDALAELVGTDAYRIQASIAVDRLEWIKIPRQAGHSGSKVRVFYGRGHECSGTVTRLMADLASEGRMARILIIVPDPLDLKSSDSKRQPLLIGEYVRVEIEGRRIDNVFQIPRTALRDNSSIWIVGEHQTLEIRSVLPIWRDADIVLLKDGLKAGERLVVSDLPAAVEGMAVRIDTPVSETTDQQTAMKKAA